jgi:hypothetical protein
MHYQLGLHDPFAGDGLAVPFSLLLARFQPVLVLSTLQQQA